MSKQKYTQGNQLKNMSAKLRMHDLLMNNYVLSMCADWVNVVI